MKNLLSSKGFWFCIMISLVMGSCKHGCTFSRVIKSKDKTEKIGNRKLTFTASLIKSRNVKYRLRTGEFSRSDAYYSVSIFGQMDSFKLTLDWYFPAEKGEDLKPYLENSKIKKSSNNKNFELYYEGEAEYRNIFQTLSDGTVIGSPYSLEYFKGKYNLNSLPSDQQLIKDLIDSATFYTRAFADETALFRYFDKQVLNENQLIKMLNHFNYDKCNLAKNYFSDDRLNNLKYKAPKFREAALKFALDHLDEKKTLSLNRDEMLRLILVLGDRNTFEKADALVFASWNRIEDGDTENYIENRIKNKKIPVNKMLSEKTAQRCKSVIDGAIAKNDKYYGRDQDLSIESAAKFMLWTQNRSYIEKYGNFVLKHNEDNDFAIENLVDQYFTLLSSDTKAKITAICKKNFSDELAKDNALDAARWYNMLHKTVSCSEAKTYYSQYKKKYEDSPFINEVPKC